MEKADFMVIILIFVAVILGVSLTPTISDLGHTIAIHNNSSAVLKAISPYLDVIWFAGCLGLAGGLGYVEVNKYRKK